MTIEELLGVTSGEWCSKGWRVTSNDDVSALIVPACITDPGEALANSQLAAAAKDLFASLYDAVQDAEFFLANDLGPKSCVENWLPAAKNALKKAGLK